MNPNLRTEILALHSSHVDAFFRAEEEVMKAALGREEPVTKEKEVSHLVQFIDNIALVQVSGMMTNKDSWVNQYLGLVSYNEIRQGLVDAIENGAEGILIHIDSPGGRVAGVGDLASFISSLPVPTVTYTDSLLASAAYLTGLQSDYVYADGFAEVGSVGVIAVVADASKMYSDLGVKFHRFRSGDLKQVGDPRFSLSKKETEYLSETIDTFAEKFFNIVAEGRGMPRPMLDNLDITSGRTFIGETAVAVGLVDMIMSFDQAVAKTLDFAQKSIDKKSKLSSIATNQFRI